MRPELTAKPIVFTGSRGGVFAYCRLVVRARFDHRIDQQVQSIVTERGVEVCGLALAGPRDLVDDRRTAAGSSASLSAHVRLLCPFPPGVSSYGTKSSKFGLP